MLTSSTAAPTRLINAAPTNSTSADQLNYIEQAFLSLKPPKAKGFELDFGKFVTSAGAEVIEAKDNWNYSRSLLFVNAIPYWHFGARTSMPVSKTETIGFQLVNGWNNVSKTNGGVTGVFTSAYVKPKDTWDLNYYRRPGKPQHDQRAAQPDRHHVAADAARKVQRLHQLRLRPESGCDRGHGRWRATATPSCMHWQGVAVAVHEQADGKDCRGRPLRILQRSRRLPDRHIRSTLYEGTFTYEYKWVEGLLMRVEYRCDCIQRKLLQQAIEFSQPGAVSQQQTLTVAFIAFFGPKR